MSTSWNIEQLRDYIKQHYSSDSTLVAIVNSLVRYTLIYAYHRKTAIEAMEGVVNEDDPDIKESIDLVFGRSEQQTQYHRAKIANEANLFGAIHSTRAMFDIFAQLVNGLILRNKFEIGKCDLCKVTDRLESSDLKNHLFELRQSFWFRYVQAFVNTIKHRRLMTHRFSVNIEAGIASFYVDGFSYKDEKFKKYSDKEILQGTLDVNKRIVDCGNALNLELIKEDV